MSGEIFRMTAKTFVIDGNGDFLTLRRSAHVNHRPGTWDFVGGKGEPGESPEQAARREGIEEIGIDLGRLEFLTTIPKKNGETHLFVREFEEIKPKIVLSDEHDASLWLPGQDLLLLDMPEKYRDTISEHFILREAVTL